MADAEARRAAIKKASEQVRAGGVFSRATSASKVSVARPSSTTRTANTAVSQRSPKPS